MGTFKQGILGGFSGKVGPVIGSSWKGKAVMRAIALSYNDANSEAQQQQRAKFGLVSKFISSVTGFTSVGFKSQAVGMTEANAAMMFNLPEVISGTWPSYTIDYSKALLSKGNVDLPYAPQASVTGTDLELSWTDNSGIGNALSSDYINVIAYNKDRNQSVCDIDSKSRNARSATLSLPATWTGDTIHVYLAAHRNGSAETSNSIYLGNFTI